jgi:transposase
MIIAQNSKNWPEKYRDDVFYIRRFVTVDLLNAHWTYEQIKELVGVASASIHRWWTTYKEGGYDALAALPRPGRREGVRPPRRTLSEPAPRLWGQSRVIAKKEVIRRIFEEGHTQNQVSRDMNIRVATVNSWVRRFREDPETFLDPTRRDYYKGRPRTLAEALANLEAGRTRLNAADVGLPEPLPIPDWEFEVE